MLKRIKSTLGLATCLAASLAAPPAHAFFELGKDSGTTAYEWYFDGIYQNFTFADGVDNDPTYGYRNFLQFQGTAVSTQGHCLELETEPSGVYTGNPDTVIWVDDHGTLRKVDDDSTDDNGSWTLQSRAHIWIGHNTGASLHWMLHIDPYSNQGGGDDFKLTVRRLEVSESQCTTGQTLSWASIKGSTASYTVTLGNTH